MGLPITPLVISYNGVNFLHPGTETVGCNIRPLPDASGRAVKVTQYELTIRTYFGDDTQLLAMSTDLTMESVRKRLTAYGGYLRYQNVGLGLDLAINVPSGGGIRDALWGPKPTVLSWKPMGQAACEVTWSVTFAIPECDNAVYRFAPMEFCFKVTHQRDRSGYTTRTYTGHVAVPQSKLAVDNHLLTDTADAYLENVDIPVPVGFRRIPPTTTLSEDKCRLDFTFVDEEMGPNYLPQGAVQCRMSYSASNPTFYSSMWTATLNATYEIARGYDRSIALLHFVDYVNSRMIAPTLVNFQPDQGAPVANTVMPLSFSATHDDITGRGPSNFSFTFTYLSALKDLINTSGMWKPLNYDYTLWKTSLSLGPGHLRGNARMKSMPGDDVIIDLCHQGVAAMNTDANRVTPTDGAQLTGFQQAQPPQETSWIHYEAATTLLQRDRAARPRRLPAARIDYGSLSGTVSPPAYPTPPLPPTGTDGGTRPAAGLGLTGSRAGTIGVYGSADEDGASTLTQVKNTPEFDLVFTGSAIRAGYPITPPAVVTVGGRKAEPANDPDKGDGFVQSTPTNHYGRLLYMARWQLRYRVIGTPNGEIPVIQNPTAVA